DDGVVCYGCSSARHLWEGSPTPMPCCDSISVRGSKRHRRRRRLPQRKMLRKSQRHAPTTCTETSIPLNAPDEPAQVPASGIALSCSRATATETCSPPASLLLVGSKPRHPAPGR